MNCLQSQFLMLLWLIIVSLRTSQNNSLLFYDCIHGFFLILRLAQSRNLGCSELIWVIGVLLDKGQEIHLCLRDKGDGFNLHDINTLMFVALHELAHVASVKTGHGDEFKINFVWILKNATQIGIFKNVDYAKNNVKFCGEVINSNPLISSMRILKN